MHKTSNSSKNRLKFARIIVALIVFFLAYRLVKVQVINSDEYKKGALLQWTKNIDIKSERGIIYDRNGRKMAVNVTSFTLWATPSDIENKEETARLLKSIIEIDQDYILELISKDTNVVKIQQYITREQAEEIRNLGIRGISIVDDNKRYYPFGNFAAYILGFTGIDNNGLYGLEKVYEKYLTGVPGVWVKVTDRDNRQLPFDTEKIYEARHGNALKLTIDETIQHFAEQASEDALINNKAKSVSIIVMNPKTGEILALANKPDYDPNNPRINLDEDINEAWEALEPEERQEKWFEMWRNYAINDIYEPGSTFKIVTAAASLEEASANLNTHYFCNGFVRDIKGVVIRCSSWYDPHGDQDFSEAFSNSCNVAFVEMARQLGREKMFEYIKAFGFGEPTGIDLLGEQKGIIPISVDSIKEVNLATLSYGHGIAVTPIQMINAISVIANGGNLMTPYMVDSIIDDEENIIQKFEPIKKRQVISEKTANEILTMLEQTVNEGTGRKAYIPGYRVGGKTGTAQKIIDGRYVDEKYISSFGGIAPIDDPEIAILVIVDEPTGVYYGGTVAGPYAKYVIENTLQYLEVPRVYTEEESELIEELAPVPNVVGLKISEAGQILSEAGFKYTTEYEEFTQDTLVIDQFPKNNEPTEKGSIIDLYLESGLNVPVLSEESIE
ncbi:MAG: penicillin-binding transpeptidase domain-containing protein [Gudongella sp.]|nr:penicillin-binding transpeptidase domain-containing protein [Gudongella sp.]